jgi:glycosyltransferase involved in cell wall biosynthesis
MAMSKKEKLLLFTSIYPLPWKPNKATFNFQQYSRLSNKHDVEFLVPVPWFEWVKNLKLLLVDHNYKHVCYFPFFYIPGIFRSLNSFFLVFSIIICVFPLLKMIKAKTVLASWAFPDGLACAWLKKLCKYRLYIQCLGSDINVHVEQPFRRKLLQKSFEKADGVITVSKALENKVKELVPNGTTQTIYNGVNFKQFTISNEKFSEASIVFIGNIIKTKGVYELIEAAKQIINTGNMIHFHFIGNGPELNAINNIVQQNDLSGQITLHGSVNHDEVVELLQKCHALVLPSYREGVPNVIMEAFACGVPVIATNVGGISEVLNKSNGILLNSYQTSDIVDGIEQCFKAEWQSEKIRASIANFTWEENIDQLDSFLFHEHY